MKALAGKSLSIVTKIQESFRLQSDTKLFETDNTKKKWYHFHLKAPGERKLANRATLAFANPKLEAKYLEERFNRMIWQVRVFSASKLSNIFCESL